MNVDQEWELFLKTAEMDCCSEQKQTVECPKPSELYISTKTKIAYLNQPIDIHTLFWDIPIASYESRTNCVIKKQIKQVSFTAEELSASQLKIKEEDYTDQYIITSINNPTGRVKFKDIRKISIGLSKKDVISSQVKKKSAFYNCFVLIFRMFVDDVFKEFHMKVFNTGKVEVPGIQNEPTFNLALQMLLDILQPHVSNSLYYLTDKIETVLINSNFKCGFFINREALYDLLKYKYNIHAIFDPCSYPGIQCKFYYNSELEEQTGSQTTLPNTIEVSFMIFRTGSILIVGKCEEEVLIVIYDYLKNLLIREYSIICQRNTIVCDTTKIKKTRRKMFGVEVL
jgi:hypothetical protein